MREFDEREIVVLTGNMAGDVHPDGRDEQRKRGDVAAAPSVAQMVSFDQALIVAWSTLKPGPIVEERLIFLM